MRLQNFDDRFLYVIKFLDKNISNYLSESQEAINFYYTCRRKKHRYKNFICSYLYNYCITFIICINNHCN